MQTLNYIDCFYVNLPPHKNLTSRFAIKWLVLKSNNREFRFKIDIEKINLKTNNTINKFIVLKPPPQKKGYIFAFKFSGGANRAKIYKRID